MARSRLSVLNVDASSTQPQRITWRNVMSARAAVPVSQTALLECTHLFLYCKHKHSSSSCQTYLYTLCIGLFMRTSQLHFFNIIFFSVCNPILKASTNVSARVSQDQLCSQNCLTIFSFESLGERVLGKNLWNDVKISVIFLISKFHEVVHSFKKSLEYFTHVVLEKSSNKLIHKNMMHFKVE